MSSTKPRNKTIQKMYSLTPSSIEKLNELYDAIDAVSDSEVVRRAIDFLHEKKFPKYVSSPKGSPEDIEEKSKIVSLSNLPEPAIISNLDGLLVNTAPSSRFAGEDVVLFHSYFGGIKEVPVSSLKDWVRDNPETVAEHQNVRAASGFPGGQGLLEGYLFYPALRQNLEKRGIILPSQEEGKSALNKALSAKNLPEIK